MSFTVYPALDIRDGQVVRLLQGDYAQQTTYGDDPLPRAQAFAAAGAQWMHLVDLDAARAGGYTLAPLLARIAADTRLQVQTGGGVRCRDDVARILDAGASRVVVGSLAVREPAQVLAWLREFGAARLTIALDTRQGDDGVWRLPVHGWTETADVTLDELAVRYAQAGMQHLLCTDIARDGMLSGPNLDLYAHLSRLLPGVAVQASGGVRDVADVAAARAAGCAGAVLGKALLEGRLQLQEALAC
ncbi:1-(5-phosphoribosyl)-5-[(5-phosphoribosylamino)methylideneamino]imidazole-4-carboxamide isomerase [Stenotrophomonas acidaminiphila]|jgi:phosphoribosylformimino-5-aminoimidazole carboxamide ribotide isomerase|uniref:1-(5-phosphoribosyl)-5-[(5-phosphoribosylamino)methylideneamino] imidazole-4-carboxamide isomerase n=1 Tax=Stenotrophomonas acidaminiphila TaxID=128780 RepID=A0A0S1B090_9GAMM|nr:1-(5-phosphoribosyl)-5-[(5-phosphoribosylamino)methylideneamino]imidazole-4-carboxamide isomerase [Stenotrophomonas acidaminiphila]ALJ28454.1 1-(5-phosphoribosyl)-5-[(5- phosphoribosylamino)methylideneamino] imidazole-4-carboxamide isomerase [Stenotrophomonas acidaminiphila]OZB51787.1 MAG: 1-(5-phosphoribosyl)-5-((5-phosphoribosylamino)methylideneamino)imidazole-4-carboxamide isomerase [Stenotrophomonas sp. 14-69-23]WHL17406.1 1-(5-phosphoribosyl)-5-[(5-phosphoribosylamino)methylideneamino]im